MKIVLPDDPSAPFDPASSSTAASPPRPCPYTTGGLDPGGSVRRGRGSVHFHARPLREAGQDILGELVWVQTKDLADPQRGGGRCVPGHAGNAQVDCRNALQDCAGTAAAESDRTPQGIAWSIDQLDRLRSPRRTASSTLTKPPGAAPSPCRRPGGGASSLTMSDTLVGEVLAALKPSVDVYGTNWTPPTNISLLGSPAP